MHSGYRVTDDLARQLGRVVVVYGGESAEREVSLKSGQAVLNALVAAGVDAIGLDLTGTTLSTLLDGNFDRVFIALHGRGGEDGALQGMLEWIGLPYTGSGVMASALAMDKLRTKQIWQSMGLPTPAYAEVRGEADTLALIEKLGTPLCVKPANEGSSIGVFKVHTLEELDDALLKAARHDESVLVEQWIQGPEYTVGVLAGEAMPVIGLQAHNEFYDYDAKYVSDDTEYLLPSGLCDADEEAMKKLALDAFRAIGCEGWGRVDVMLDSNARPFLLEVNTVPGMTDHSLVPMAAAHTGMSFDELVVTLLVQTLPARQEVEHA